MSAQDNPTAMEPVTPQFEDFVHLHVHSEYSLLDGSIRIKKLIKELVKRNAMAASLTDHDGMHGILEFYLECKEKKINGIIGYEANVESVFAKNIRPCHHLVLLAENDIGYANLVRLCSLANTTGKSKHGPDSTSVDWENLKQMSAGLICLTSCLQGELSTLLETEGEQKAGEYLNYLIEIFGKQNVFVELIDNNLAQQKAIIPKLVALAKAHEVEIVATADVHYLHKSDQETHVSLLAIKHKIQRNDIRGISTEYEFHLTTAAEMKTKFAEYPEAISNTIKIANRCKVYIDTKSFYMPDFRIHPDESADDCMVRLARAGLEERKPAILAVWGEAFTDEMWADYHKRLEYELEVILKMKFSGYFLIVQDFINWAKDQQIPVGPGRGSAAGSLVVYSLKITNIDPIRFNLLFERFLNPERISMPDIDTDFCQNRRGEVIDYVYKRYGQSNVSQIVTFGRLMAKNALKNLARITGWNFLDSNEFAKLIPETPGITLEAAYAEEERIRDRLSNDDRANTLWKGATEIEGILNSLGVHAAGVIISDSPLSERCPMMESEGQMLTQLEYKYAEKIGLIKFDFLGLKTLTVIDKTVKLVHIRHDKNFDIETINLDDPKVYESISTAHVTGIFQLESGGMRKLIADLKPTCFNDIIAVIALFRPGPLGSGMVEDFVLRKHGKNPVDYLFPQLEDILSDTYGVIVYQEQVQKIAAVLANYSLGEADLLRRAMGKKDKNEMERQKARFVSGSVSNNLDEQMSGELFDLMAKFAEYGFNKSHTAAYGWVTFQTAYLKTYYPTEFMTAIMSCDLDNTDKIVTYVRDCKRMKIRLLPPCVNAANFEFSVPADKCIQFGLGAIKGLGKGIIETIVAEREKNGPFQTVPEFIARVDARKINKKVMESLTKSGAFDNIASNRAEIMANSEAWLRTISKECDRSDSVGSGIFGLFDEPETAPKADKLKISAQKTNFIPTPRKGIAFVFEPLKIPTQTVPDESPVKNLLMGAQLKPTPPWPYLTQLEEERNILGFYMTGHPADVMRQDIEELSQFQLCEAPLHLDGDDVPDHRRKPFRIAGCITAIFEKKTKENEKFCILKVEDGTGELEIALFPKQYAALTHKYAAGDFVWLECKIKKGIEEGTVKGVCQSISPLADKRIERARRLILRAQESFLNDVKNLQQLTEVLTSFKGETPVALEILMPKEELRVRARFDRTPVKPTDELILKLENLWPGLVLVERSYRQAAAP